MSMAAYRVGLAHDAVTIESKENRTESRNHSLTRPLPLLGRGTWQHSLILSSPVWV